MNTRLILLLILAVLLAGPVSAAQAQTGANPPPTIIRFTIDLPVITLADAEAGATAAILSWRTVGMMGDVRLRLETFQLNTWVPLVNETEQPLDPTGRLPIIVQHPLNFGPPTYRLTILDAQEHVLDERIVLVPYDLTAVEEPAAIESFTTGATGVEVNALARGEVRIPVAWQVVNRPPTANLVFEQVMPDGATVSVELPRAALWVSSTGQGTVAPVLPPNGDRTVRLRLRLVDLESGETLASQEIALPISGTLATPTATLSPTRTALPPTPAVFVPTALPPTPNAPVIVSFTASPDLVDRGGTVTVSWHVTGASDITVWRLDPVGRLSESRTAQPATGAWTVTLHSGYVDSAVFYLYAVAPGGAQAQATVTVLIRCPYTYFFGATPTGEGCPLAGPTDVPGAYQPFQGGFMLWRGDMRQILALANGGQVYRYQDTWVEGEPIPTVEAPPPGLEAPMRGFGKVWALNPSVRQVLGWPTGGEQSYTLRAQQSGAARYARTYMTLPDGRVIYVVENTWQFLP